MALGKTSLLQVLTPYILNTLYLTLYMTPAKPKVIGGRRCIEERVCITGAIIGLLNAAV
jgi:hypothetical protein